MRIVADPVIERAILSRGYALSNAVLLSTLFSGGIIAYLLHLGR